MEITLAAKIKISPTDNQIKLIEETYTAYCEGCNYVSEIIYKTGITSQRKLHKKAYLELRKKYKLRSQMAQSVIKTSISKYKSLKSNGHDWNLVKFKKREYDLVWSRDYSLNKNLFSINTLEGRIKVGYEIKGMEKYFEEDWSFGTAKLIKNKRMFFLHIPVTKNIKETRLSEIKQIVGIDLGLNFIATIYDSDGKTKFYNGGNIKDKRAHYSQLRKQLQKKKTPSSRRKLKKIGRRESRWMADVNHQITKELVDYYEENTLFVLEDLSNVRNATEKVRKKDRYFSVSWSFYQFRSFLEYKALMNDSKVILVSPKYTSQTCPKCGHTEKNNRNKRKHIFKCKECEYTSNDDRVAAMNIRQKGIEYLAEKTTSVY